MQSVSKVLEMHDECIRNYQIVYQQIEIDTRQTRGRRVTRRTAYFAKQTTYFLWQKELRLISEVPGRPRSQD